MSHILDRATKTNLLQQYPELVSVGETLHDGSDAISLSIPRDADVDTSKYPDQINGHPVIITRRDPPQHEDDDPQLAVRPLKPGASTSNYDTDAGTGTIGFLFDDGGTTLMSSNHHVWAAGGGSQGDRIIQPGGADNPYAGNGDYHVGTLQGNMYFSTSRCDLAWATIKDEFMYEAAPLNLPEPEGWRAPSVGDPVRKSGRTTGVTKGTVAEANVSITSPNGTDIAHDQFYVDDDGFTDNGDSGSAVMFDDGTNEAAGMSWGGVSGGGTAAMPITAILEDTGFDLVTADTGPPTYNGTPRTEYTYCGPAEHTNTFDAWVSGDLTTSQFARQTPQGAGTAQLTLGECETDPEPDPDPDNGNGDDDGNGSDPGDGDDDTSEQSPAMLAGLGLLAFALASGKLGDWQR